MTQFVVGCRAESEIKVQRLEARFLGHVQGVGFRYTTRRLAMRWPVSGYVENQEDGSVFLVVEGERSQIQGLIDEISETMRSNIRATQTHWGVATGKFTSFEIRR